MADSGNGADDLFANEVFGTSAGLVSSAWEQQNMDHFQTCHDLLFQSGYYHPYPPVDPSAELTGFADHVNFGGHVLDDETWAFPPVSPGSDDFDLSQFQAPSPPQSQASFSLNQAINARFAEQMTPPSTQQPQQHAVKQEYSPSQAPLQHQYSHLGQNGLIIPQFGPANGSLASSMVQVPHPVRMGRAPLSPTSPVRRKRRPSRRLSPSSPTDNGGAGTSRPTRRMIKRQAKSSNKEDLTPHEAALLRLAEAEGTGVFRQHIASREVAVINHAALMCLYSQNPDECTSPHTDASFPVRNSDELAYVKDFFDAIWDWTDYGEMAKTLGPEQMALRDEAAALADDDPRKAHLLDQLMSRPEQQKKVLSKVLSDYVVEEICWRLLQYAQDAQQGIAIVDYCLRTSKQLVKSLLSAGTGWCMRIANNPKGEFTHKVNNMKVNRRKNERLREATIAQKKEEE